MLYTSENDSRYGDESLMTGFWVVKQKGWFFKAKYFNELISMGAKEIKTIK